MADDAPGGAAHSPKGDPEGIVTIEDAETRATRKELKQHSISDQSPEAEESSVPDVGRPKTPEANNAEGESHEREQISSPKKKRAHDQLDVDQEAQDNDSTSVASTDSARDRGARLEPEKKRHRDEESTNAHTVSENQHSQSAEPPSRGNGGMPNKTVPETSASAFAASGFGKLASGSSAFAALGSSPGRGFSSTKAAQPPAAADQTPKLTFGSNAALSPFANITSALNGTRNVFGTSSSLAGFSSGAITKPSLKEKSVRAFGAPDTNEDSDDEDEEGEDGGVEVPSSETDRDASPDKDSDEKKKPRLHRIEIDDGETGEVTVVSVRAKVFSLDKETGWKERGAGMLKINVPQACVDFDEAGSIIPGSFEASGLEADEASPGKSAPPKVARLILRQDQTHRVILNTAILPAMEFQEKATLNSVGILFTALEGADAKPVSITMRMSAANAKIFLNEVTAIQREIRGN